MLNKKIKIFYLITELERGGAETLLLDLCLHMPKDKFDVSIGYLRGQGLLADEFRNNGIPVESFKLSSRLDLIGLLKIVRFLREHKFDIMHTHLIDADIYGFLAAKFAGVKVIVSTKHNPDDFRKTQSPAILLDSFIANHTHKIIAVSCAVRDFLIKYQKIKPEKIEVIYNGIDIEKFTPKKEKQQAKIALNLKPENFIIGCIARFNAQKGHKYLIEAIPNIIANIHDVHFIFAGIGPLSDTIRKQAEMLKILDKITFLGLRTDIAAILNAMDIFVLPSLWEGLGIVLLEAQAAGVPVVASKVDGIMEVVQDNKTGVLVLPEDSEQIAQAIISLIKHPDMAKSYGMTGRQYVTQNFSIEQMTKKIESLYLNIQEQ